MDEQNKNLVYEFDGFVLDPVRRKLIHNGSPIQFTAKAFATLLVLVRLRGATVTKTDLMNSVWADSAVEENNLTQQISALRRKLGASTNNHRFSVTSPGRGYSFVADVKLTDREAEPRSRTLRWARIVGQVDPAALRGYSLAVGQILLVGLAFLWSAFTTHDQTRPQSLAVLNFKVAVTGDEFIGTGISETLRARLGSVEDLIVRPAPADADAFTAGQQLQVDAVVTGSVQRDQDRVT